MQTQGSTMAVQQKNRLLVNQADALRVAITQGSQLLDLDIETPDIEQIKGNIYKGRISSIEPSLAAVFVDFGRERHGFMPFKEVSPEYFNKDIDPNDTEAIAKVLKIGQPIIIQVEKEERSNKGAALTTYLSLAGSYLVLMPNNPTGGGISRRIEGDEREELRNTLDQLTVPENMSVIIRTAGVNKSAKELQWDLDTLLTYFEALKLAATMDRAAPYLIHQESNVLIRTLRDYMRADIDEVILDDKTCFDQAYAYMKQVRPELLERVKYYDDSTPLFSRYQIEKQIESSLSREVRLPSGGSIIIDQTEALVAIDVNSARATRGKSIEETASNTNLEAAKEIARQLRLRDLGGLIIVDFIDMTQFKHQREVEEAFKEAVTSDRARIQFARISRFGLLEMSRQRLRSGTNKNISGPCPRCDGTGMIRSVESLSRTIVHLLEERAAAQPKQLFQISAPITVATHLANEHRQAIRKIEEGFHCQIIILPREELVTPHYDIVSSKLDTDNQNLIPSYKHLKGEPTTSSPANTASFIQEQPRIEQFLKTKEETAPIENRSGGLFNFIKQIFSSKTPVSEKVKKTSTVAPKGVNTPNNASSQKVSSRRISQQDHQQRLTKPRVAKSETTEATASKTTKKTIQKPLHSQVSSDKKAAQIPLEMNDLVLENDLSFDAKTTSSPRASAAPVSKKNVTPRAKKPVDVIQTPPLPKIEENQVTPVAATAPTAKLPLQPDVIQRPMKAGIRVSPKSESTEDAISLEIASKTTYAPGRKISEPPLSEKNESEKVFKVSQQYPAGKKIIDAHGVKITQESAV